MIKKTASDAEWYCRRDAEEELFYEVFFRMCRKYGVDWASATREERNHIERLTKVAYANPSNIVTLEEQSRL